MALQGTLKDFSIVDIFQLIAQQGKSGSLVIASEDKETHIVFDKGSMVLARFTKGHDELKIGGLIQRSGVVTRAQMAEAFEEHTRIMKSIGDVLLSKRFITQDTLSEFLNLQTREVLFRVLQWKSGVYKFKAEQFNYNKAIVKPISTDFLLMDGFRQLDEWPGILETIGSFDNVYELTAQARAYYAPVLNPAPATDSFEKDAASDAIDAAFAEFDGAGDEPAPAKTPKREVIEIDDGDKRLLPLIDGQVTVQELIDRSRLGTFDATSKLAAWIKRNFLVQVTGVSSFHPNNRSAEIDLPPVTGKLIISRVKAIMVLLPLLALLILGARPIIIDKDKSAGALGKTFPKPSILKQYQTVNYAQRVRSAVGVYLIENMDYPNDFEQLYLKEVLSDREVTWLQRRQFHYVRSLDSFHLLLPPY